MYLTEAQRHTLRCELERLTEVDRPAAAEQVIEARSQSTNQTENAPYEAALAELNRIEERILWVGACLADATGEPAPDGTRVEPGCIVTVQFAPRDKQRYLFGSVAADAGDLDIVSADSPLGRALHGAKTGDKVSYRTPTGATVTVRVKAVETA